MTIIAYARFSSTAQAEGHSLERQFNEAKAFADDRGWKIDEFISDEGKSAFHGHHMAGELGSIFKRVERRQLGHGDILIVENIDRLTREKVTDAMFSMMTLMTAGLTVVTTNDGRILTKENYDREVGDMFDTLIKVRVANEESEKKRVRQNANWEKWRAEGKLTFKAPFWMDKTKTLIPERHAVLKRMFDLAEAGHGSAAIANKLKAEGVYSFGTVIGDKTKTKKAWFSPATIAHLLRNRSVLGEYQPKSAGKPVGPVVADFYPQAITTEQFNRVQSSLSTRRFREYGSGRTGAGNMLKTVLTCAYCGNRMILSGKRDEVGYRCRLAAVKGCDNRRMFNREMVDQAILAVIREVGIKAQASSELVTLKANEAELERLLAISEENAKVTLGLWKRSPDSITIQNELAEEEANAKALTEKLAIVRAAIKNYVSPSDTHSQALSLLNGYHLLTTDDEKRDFRSRMNIILQKLIRKMTISPTGSLIFQLKDDTVYQLQYELSPNAAPRKTGARPLSDYHWRLTSRLDRAEIIQSSPANDDLEAILRQAEADAMAVIMAEPQSH